MHQDVELKSNKKETNILHPKTLILKQKEILLHHNINNKISK